MKTVEEKTKKYAQKLLKNYEGEDESKLVKLRKLDKSATRGAKIFAYIFGTLGALILGIGMCIAMEIVLEDLIYFGVAIGCVGIFMVSINYVIYKNLSKKGKAKYSKQVIELSNELLNE